MKVRRVVTGHDGEGKAVVASDETVEGISVELAPGYTFHRLWGRDEKPTFPDDGAPRPAATYFPPTDGSRFAILTIPAGRPSLREDIDLEAALEEFERKLPGMPGHLEPDTPGMHTTDTIDYLYVASGEAILELDDGAEVTVRTGDAIVQNGTRHRWRNEGTEPCVIVVVLIGARRAR
jgi:mannose-6-phosphate isomerase-like protein (cupin superfamily)